MEIYVGNLSYNTDESTLNHAFGAHGTVERVQLITDKFTGRSKGFAFVTMQNRDEAHKAIEALHGVQLDGRPLTVNEARPREERPRRFSNPSGFGEPNERPRFSGKRRDFRSQNSNGRH